MNDQSNNFDYKSDRRENLKNKNKKRPELSDQYQASKKKKTELKHKLDSLREEELWDDWESQNDE